MCCFSRPIPFVGATKIFARLGPDGRQMLAYAMDVELDAELAMVLPLPVPPRSAEDAVTFVSLEGYEGFFHDLAAAFPRMMHAQSKSRGLLGSRSAAPKLVVHDVGAFDASFVPTLADFARLDERLALPPGTWESLPGYADWGFAVFRLKPKKALLGWKRQSIHPMAMSFPTREPGALYFPLLHIHDGEVEPNASFDHELYGQADGVLGVTLGWERSKAPLGKHVDAARAKGLVDGTRVGFQLGLHERLPNMDLWLREPAGVSVADLRGAGDCHEYEVRAERAYAFGEQDARFVRWRDTASTHLATLCWALRERLPEIVAQHRAAWRLAPIAGDMPPHFINGDRLWTGSDYTNGEPAPGGGRGRVTFSPFSDDVPVQAIVLGFDELPDGDRVREIHAELSRTLQRAVAR